MTGVAESHACPLPGCHRTFKRHEHLLRHEKTHDPAINFTCPSCGKGFNRKDSLDRHIALHKSQLGAEKPKKVKRACEACRKAKTKCDGGVNCKICTKKGLECIYSDEDVSEHGLVPSKAQGFAAALENGDGGATLLAATASKAKPSLSSGIIDWRTIVVQKDPAEDPGHAASLSLTDEGKDSYLDAYFERVHHHWPIVHRVTAIESPDYPTLLSSVRMLGAWVLGNSESRQYAIVTYKQLWMVFIKGFCNVTTNHEFQRDLSPDLCHSALLSVILGFYRGTSEAVSESRTLLNAMVTALRHTGFFQESVLYRDQQVEMFLPLKMVLEGQRQRLGAYLYKVDAYLSLLMNQPPILFSHELHFTLPTTFTFYNSFGLDEWDERRLSEPGFRREMTMRDMIRAILYKNEESSNKSFLFEDFQMALCSIWPSVWRFGVCTKVIETSVTNVHCTNPQLETLQERLQDLLNRKAPESGSLFNPHNPLARHYLGIGEDAHGSTFPRAANRLHSVIFATLCLQSVLAIYVVADISSFILLAKGYKKSSMVEPTDGPKGLDEQRNSRVKQWSKTPQAREALCRSVDILALHEPRCMVLDLRGSQDPIGYLALVFASLVIWTYCMHGAEGCQLCLPRSNDQSVELTLLSCLANRQDGSERDFWINMGGGYRPQMNGLQLCSCNVGFFISQFKKYIPRDWDIGSMIFGSIWEDWE